MELFEGIQKSIRNDNIFERRSIRQTTCQKWDKKPVWQDWTFFNKVLIAKFSYKRMPNTW